MWIATIIDKGDFGREVTKYAFATEMSAHFWGGEATYQMNNERGNWHDYSVEYVEAK